MFAPARSCIRKRRNDGRLTGARTSADEAFALGALASQLANATNGLGLFTRTLLRRLFIEVAHLHFTENTFALHLLLESAESLINVVVADKYLHENPVPLVVVSQANTRAARQIDYVRAAQQAGNWGVGYQMLTGKSSLKRSHVKDICAKGPKTRPGSRREAFCRAS